MKKNKRIKVWVSPYTRKKNQVPGHYRYLNEGNIIDQITNPQITTIVELSPEADRTLKLLTYTLAGSLILSAVIKLRS